MCNCDLKIFFLSTVIAVKHASLHPPIYIYIYIYFCVSLTFWHCRRCAARKHISPYLFIICLDYVLRTSTNLVKENGFTLAKARSRTITDMNYTDDIALLASTPVQAESLLHSLEWGAGGIGLHINADKIEFMCFKQRGNISTSNGRFLKLVDKFTYLVSSVSSTEKNLNIRLAKESQLLIHCQSYGSKTY